MKLTIRMDDVGVRRYLDGLARNQIPFAQKVALQRVARDARDDLMNQVRTKLHEPVRWTTRQVSVQFANAKARAIVYGLREDLMSGSQVPAYELLQHLFVGGPRVQTGFERRLVAAGLLGRGERLVTGKDAPVNKHGNLPPAWYRQMGMQLTAEKGKASAARSGRQRRAFFWSPGGRLRRGVYMRTGKGSGRGVLPILIAVTGSQYRARISVDDVVRKAVTQHWPRRTREALDLALRTAR